MKHDTYSIESMHGQAMREGLQNTLENVLALAQQDADDLAEPVFVYNQDGDEWEVTPATARCQCGAITGERCEGEFLPRSAMIGHRYVPAYLVETAKACGSDAGLAYSILLRPDCAKRLLG